MQNPHLSIVQDVTEVSDDIGQFDDLFPAFFKLSCDTVALTDVPAHLWYIRKNVEEIVMGDTSVSFTESGD